MTMIDALCEAGFLYSGPLGDLAPPPAAYKVRREARRAGSRLFVDGETAFSRAHGDLSRDGYCWICLFPLASRHTGPHSDLWTSSDHVIPRSCGGKSDDANIRSAHRICNSKRGSKQLDRELVVECRLHMIRKYLFWIGEKQYDRSTGLRPNI